MLRAEFYLRNFPLNCFFLCKFLSNFQFLQDQTFRRPAKAFCAYFYQHIHTKKEPSGNSKRLFRNEKCWKCNFHQTPDRPHHLMCICTNYIILSLPFSLSFIITFAPLKLSKGRPWKLPTLACRCAYFTCVYLIQIVKLACNCNIK